MVKRCLAAGRQGASEDVRCLVRSCRACMALGAACWPPLLPVSAPLLAAASSAVPRSLLRRLHGNPVALAAEQTMPGPSASTRVWIGAGGRLQRAHPCPGPCPPSLSVASTLEKRRVCRCRATMARAYHLSKLGIALSAAATAAAIRLVLLWVPAVLSHTLELVHGG